jgi:hypothetical protein
MMATVSTVIDVRRGERAALRSTNCPRCKGLSLSWASVYASANPAWCPTILGEE